MPFEPIRRISFLINNPGAWSLPAARAFAAELAGDYAVTFARRDDELPEGDVAFFLNCSRIVPAKVLARHRLNLVVHASDLPRGRGFSPVPWQVLEGKNDIPVCLFEAVEALDAGPVWQRTTIRLDGTELLPEIREKVWAATRELITRFLAEAPRLCPQLQNGEPTFFRRRTAADDELDPTRSLADQFDRLRIVDNDRYPAWFRFRGRKYILKISEGPQ